MCSGFAEPANPMVNSSLLIKAGFTTAATDLIIMRYRYYRLVIVARYFLWMDFQLVITLAAIDNDTSIIKPPSSAKSVS